MYQIIRYWRTSGRDGAPVRSEADGLEVFADRRDAIRALPAFAALVERECRVALAPTSERRFYGGDGEVFISVQVERSDD